LFLSSIPFFRQRSLWRLRAPVSPDEVRRIERWLATARVFLAISALIAVLMDPGEIDPSWGTWAAGLLAFYIAQGMVIIILLRRRQESTTAFRLLVHSADIVWPALISLFATGQSNPFFLFYVFVIVAAAYRWGLPETLATAIAAIGLLWAESLALHYGFINAATHTSLEPQTLFMRSMYLLVLGLLLGSLAEQQKQLRTEKAVITRVLGRASVEAGLAGTLQGILGEFITMYNASYVVLASQEANSHHIFVSEVRSLNGTPTVLNWLEPAATDRQTYLYDSPGNICFARRLKNGISCVALSQEGVEVSDMPIAPLAQLAERHPFKSVITMSFQFPKAWWGRIFLFEPVSIGRAEDELRFLQELIRHVGPAVYNVYLLRRLRLRAGAVERARFARELHDGAVQSLIAMEMQVDVLKRQAVNNASVVPDELSRIQKLMREEVLKLRELMQQMKSLDVDSRRIVPFLADTVERFQRETGISARFICHVDELDMPQQICRELARIVQEGLVNVRKHSGAKHVLVRLSADDGKWKITIEDDGAGFPFSGTLSLEQMESQRKGPVVIKERVHLIAGELTIESNPGLGSRLEVSIPQNQNREVAYGQP
jgi:signal transduction histidine kinase